MFGRTFVFSFILGRRSGSLVRGIDIGEWVTGLGRGYLLNLLTVGNCNSRSPSPDPIAEGIVVGLQQDDDHSLEAKHNDYIH